MGPSGWLRMIGIVIAPAIVGSAMLPLPAASSAMHDGGAPPWLDRTIYRPDCTGLECACPCRVPRECRLGCEGAIPLVER